MIKVKLQKSNYNITVPLQKSDLYHWAMGNLLLATKQHLKFETVQTNLNVYKTLQRQNLFHVDNGLDYKVSP